MRRGSAGETLPAGALSAATPGDRLRGGVFLGAFLLVWISTAPFRGNYQVPAEESGNIVNQLAFSLTAVLGLAAVAASPARAAARAYLRPAWLLLLAWMALSVLNSANPDVSMRAFRFTLVVLTIGATAMLLPRDERHFADLLASVALVVLLVCYGGLVLAPGVAMHSAGDLFEPEHAGAWRGLFDHKNIAGAMMAILMMIGIFVMREGRRAAGLTILILAGIFLFFSNSKTSMLLGPFVVGISMVCARIRSLWLRALLALGPLALLLTATLGAVLFEPVDRVLQALSPGQSFTGRSEIWRFALDRLWNRPILGYGFEGFWQSDYVRFAETGENETGISQGMVHGHSGYVDLAVGLGLPGLLIGIVVLVILPLRDHHRVLPTRQNRELAELFFRIWLFAIYSACLESFFFRRADPVWFALLVAVVGLRLTARYRVLP